jgi:hypothetical protein
VTAEAIRWAANNGADVLSCSLAVDTSPVLVSAVTDVTRPGGIGREGKGCVVVFSAGNNNALVPGFKNLSEVIAVGAADDRDRRWSFSNYGPGLDIVAPAGGPGGLWITTTDITGAVGYWTTDYTGFSHTSSACPIVAGVAALILSVEPDLTSDQVRHFLMRSARDLGEPGRDDQYGWGRVDARAALDMVLAKRADLNDDWKVDLEDLVVLVESWHTDAPQADIAPATKRDGVVDDHDLDLLMRYWQTDIPEPGLLARWTLDETEGIVAHDNVGANDGVVAGNALWRPENGMLGGALELDGIDDHVASDLILDPRAGSFSIFAWIKGGMPGQVIVSQADAKLGRKNYPGCSWLGIDAVGAPTTDLGSPESVSLQSDVVITDGQWHRIALVWDKSSKTSALYVDGVEVAAYAEPALPTIYGGLLIGCDKDQAPGTFFSGLIDDVRIYSRAVWP